MSKSKLTRDTLWNLFGQGAPLLAGLVTVPWLNDGLGTARFGVLTLAWLVIGYFNLFDLGMGRALTKLVAQELGAGDARNVGRLVWTALALMLLLGIVGFALVLLLLNWLTIHAFRVPTELAPETRRSVQFLAPAIPIVVVTTGLRGVLEAYQRFALVSVFRSLMGLFNYVGPIVVLHYSHRLDVVVALLAVGRLVAFVAHLVACLTVASELRSPAFLRGRSMLPLLGFSGWVGLSTMIFPIMEIVERFLVGALVSVVAVAYYATPYEFVTKLWIVPSAVAGVLFPTFASISTRDRTRTNSLFWRGTKAVFIILFPVCLIFTTFAHSILTVWLGPPFADGSALVLQLLASGVLVNSLSTIPFALVQATGRADLTAKLLLAELPLYLVASWFFIGEFGVTGAAAVWLARGIIDTSVLFIMSHRMLRFERHAVDRSWTSCCFACLALTIGFLPAGLVLHALCALVLLGGFAALVWLRILDGEERSLILNWVQSWMPIAIRRLRLILQTSAGQYGSEPRS
jgi:O-antigen/teichoic acid export membrane protein